MGSLSFAEIAVIVIVILVVFGPRRLPELSRRAGSLLAKLRESTTYVREAIDSEYGEHMEPIRELKQEMDGLKNDVTRTVSSIGDVDKPPKSPTADTPQAEDQGEDQAGSADR